VIPDSVKTIDDWAFALCKGITGLSLGDSVTYIGTSAFMFCDGITGEIIFPSSIEHIEVAAFRGCDGITKIHIKSGVVHGYAFDECTSLEEVIIEDGVDMLDYDAFSACTSLDKVTIYSEDVSFGYDVFYNTHPDLIIFGYAASTAETYAKNNNHLFVALDEREIISSGRCGDNLTWVLYADGELVISGTGDMYDWSTADSAPWLEVSDSIVTLTVSENVTSISANAFIGCNALESVTVSSDVESIGAQAFMGCSALVEVTVYSNDVVFGKDVFVGVNEDCKIYGYTGSTSDEYEGDDFPEFIPLDAFTLTGALTTYLSATDAVTLSLFAPDTTEPAYTITLAGDAKEYKFDAVAPGTYTMVVEKKNHVTREYEVVIGEEDATQDVKIHLIGDLDGNGKVNTRDWNAVRDHINKSAVITDSYMFACADIDGNGKVNTRDWNAIRDHINKSNPLW